MEKEKLFWMNYSIELANNTKDEHLRVGAVLVTENNKLICSAYTDECSDLPWYTILMSKLKNSSEGNVHFLFLTINTLSSKSEFDLNRLIKKN